MKIKKYTIDQEIPKGSVFMFEEIELDRSLTKKRYFYFLVEEENEEDMPEYNSAQLSILLRSLEDYKFTYKNILNKGYALTLDSLLVRFKNVQDSNRKPLENLRSHLKK